MNRFNSIGFSLLAALVAVDCGSSVSPDSGLDASSRDVQSAVDAPSQPDVAVADASGDVVRPFLYCEAPSECDRLSTPTNVQFSRAWSCIANRCVFEPRGAMNCPVDGMGCVRCAGQPPVCLGATACLVSVNEANVRFEGSNCARAYFGSIRDCSGSFVRLNDGEVCLLTEAPTGAIRYVLNCGICETVFTPMGR